MANAMGPSSDYLVSFYADRDVFKHEAVLTLIEGYTTKADIPRIIALRYGTGRITIDSVQPYTAPRFS